MLTTWRRCGAGLLLLYASLAAAGDRSGATIHPLQNSGVKSSEFGLKQLLDDDRDALRQPGQRGGIASDAQRASGKVEIGPVPSVGILPGEFEPQKALLLGCGQMVEEVPDLFAQIVLQTRGHVEILALVRDAKGRRDAEKLLESRHVTAPHVHYLEVHHDSMWTRDYGPMVVRQPSGKPALIDAVYDCAERSDDDAVPLVLGRLLKMPVIQAPLWIDGGNLLSNGNGLVLATYDLVSRNEAPGTDLEALRHGLAELYGARELVFLQPLFGEPTGHVDMFATFVSPSTVVVGQLNPTEDPENAPILDENAARLSRVRVAGGKLQVIRVPMPKHDDGIWRTYTNVLYANSLVLVPQYPGADDEGGRAALKTFARILPAKSVVGVDANAAAELGGALHCVAMNLADVDLLHRNSPPRFRDHSPAPAARADEYSSSR